jgi:hypothetical protein
VVQDVIVTEKQEV